MIYELDTELDGVMVRATLTDYGKGLYKLFTYAYIVDEHREGFYCYNRFDYIGGCLKNHTEIDKYYYRFATDSREKRNIDTKISKTAVKVKNTIIKKFFELD